MCWMAGETVCGSACEVWSILRHEAGESSKGGTPQGTVNPSKKCPLYPQVSWGNLCSRSAIVSSSSLMYRWAPVSLWQWEEICLWSACLILPSCDSWPEPGACFLLWILLFSPQKVLIVALCTHSLTEQNFSTRTSLVQHSQWLCFLSNMKAFSLWPLFFEFPLPGRSNKALAAVGLSWKQLPCEASAAAAAAPCPLPWQQ